MEMKKDINHIISYCNENKISTTLLADALDKKGVVPFVYPLTENQYEVGIIECIFASDGSNYYLHKEIASAKQNSVVVIFANDCEGKALLGELVVKFLFEVRKIKALVVHGAIRDVKEIKSMGYKIWCNGRTPIGCVNHLTKDFPRHKKDEIYAKYEGAVVVCDETGVVAIPKGFSPNEIIGRIDNILNKERVWFHCLEKLEMNTFEIVCQNKYT